MKTKFTLLVFMAVAFFGASAQQITNGGFENWTSTSPAYPVNWDTYDHLVQTVGMGAIPVKEWCVKDSTPANVYAGNSSARLMTDSTSPPVNKVPGFVTNGTIGLGGNGVPYQYGWPFTGRPSKFTGAIKFMPAGADTAFYQLLLTRWNVTGDSADIIGYVQWGVISTGGGFIAFDDSINYFDIQNPDSVYITFSTSLSSPMYQTVGTKLWVDDLAFVYPTTGVVHLDMDDAVKVYPNPASSQLTVTIDDYMKGYDFEIYDLRGRLVKRTILESTVSSLDISALETGNYLYRVNNTENKMIKQGKLTVAK